MRNYEVTMTIAEGTPDECYAARIFEAPDDVTATMFAIRMPHLNGWGPGNVTITVGRHYPLIVDRVDGHVTCMAAECEVRFIDGYVVDPHRVANLSNEDLLMHAEYAIHACREESRRED